MIDVTDGNAVGIKEWIRILPADSVACLSTDPDPMCRIIIIIIIIIIITSLSEYLMDLFSLLAQSFISLRINLVLVVFEGYIAFTHKIYIPIHLLGGGYGIGGGYNWRIWSH